MSQSVHGFAGFFAKKPASQNNKLSFLRGQLELEAHILRIRSTDEYYRHTKYQRLTPSELGDRVIFKF